MVWQALEGAALLVGPTLDAQGRLWVTSGRGRGSSHLHVLDRGGRVLWESSPELGPDDVDAGAVINAVLHDASGRAYVADLDQLWCFDARGRVRWVSELREHGARGDLITPILTRRGHVGGITTDGKVVLLERDSGALALPVLDLPGVAGPRGAPIPDGMLGGGLVDPRLRQPLWDLIHGREIEVANTPAVDARSGRIFVTATGRRARGGVLYGIDELEDRLEIAFEAPLGGGSGSSPALSPDARRVYAAGGDGVMVALDARRGTLVWRAARTQAAASPAVAADGSVLSFDGGEIVALDADTGLPLWRRDHDALARARLPESRVGPRIARVDSVLTVTPERVLALVNLGYEIRMGRPLAQPRETHLVVLDLATGDVLGSTPVRDTSSAFAVPDFDGRVYVSLAGIGTSLFRHALDARLPAPMRLGREPLAGLVALEPRSPRAYAGVALAQTGRWTAAARDALQLDPVLARRDLQRARAQLGGARRAADAAGRRGELGLDRLGAARVAIDAADTSLERAAAHLDAREPGIRDELASALRELRTARRAVAR